MGFDPAKLQKFLKSKQAGAAASTATGGKGTVRRKHKAVRKAASHDDKRLKAALSKLNVRDIPAIEEVNLFKDDGNVIHFASPKVQASIAANTYVVSGNAETKKLQDLLPGIINQLGPDNLEDLKKIYASYKPGEAPAGLASLGALGGAGAAAGGDDDDDVPELVENFEEVAAKPAAKAAPKAEAPKEVAKPAAAPAAAPKAAEPKAAEPVAAAPKAETPAPKAAEPKAAEPKAAEPKKGSKKDVSASPKVEAKATPAAAVPKVEAKASPKVAPAAAPKAEPKKLDVTEPKVAAKKDTIASPKGKKENAKAAPKK